MHAPLPADGQRSILLLSVGAYQNRGCEAIVRGTMEVLRHQFGSKMPVRAGVVASESVVAAQRERESDPEVMAFQIAPPGGAHGSVGWLLEKANQRLGTGFHSHLNAIDRVGPTTSVALEVGGDNYSLDYGKPVFYVAMDRRLQRLGVPVILWGASVGPFDADPQFARLMFAHLRSLSAVCVRESDSFNYLRENGVSENVHLVADPAFVMKSKEPLPEHIGFQMPDGAIGINLSKMVAFYRGQRPSDVNLQEWMQFCFDLVKEVESLGRPIVLIPHVGNASPRTDDFDFLFSLWRAVAARAKVPIFFLQHPHSAAELKWIIGRCAVFAGARTHSTIAAISSQVPTLSIGYSLKARGINRDVYGHLRHCIHVSDLTPTNFRQGLKDLLDDETSIRAHLSTRVPELQTRAMGAGAVLRSLVAHPI